MAKSSCGSLRQAVFLRDFSGETGKYRHIDFPIFVLRNTKELPNSQTKTSCSGRLNISLVVKHNEFTQSMSLPEHQVLATGCLKYLVVQYSLIAVDKIITPPIEFLKEIT